MKPPFFGYSNSNGKIILNHNPYPNSNKSYSEIAIEVVDTFIEEKSYKYTVEKLTQKYPILLKGQNQDFPRSPQSLREWLRSPFIQNYNLINSLKKEEINEVFNYISRKPSLTKKTTDPFIGKVYCDVCGGKMKFYSNGNGRYEYYHCHNYSRGNCNNDNNIFLEDIYAEVKNIIFENRRELSEWVYPNHKTNRAIILQYFTFACFPFLKMENKTEAKILWKELIDQINCNSHIKIKMQSWLLQPTYSTTH